MRRRTAARTASGSPIEEVVLDNGQLRASILSFGAALRDLRLAGVAHPLILGFSDAQAYVENGLYFGVIVGRVANRIGGGAAMIAGRRHVFDRNEQDRNTLHGGRDGLARRNWRIEEHGEAHAVLAEDLPDGHMGFPGALRVRARYALDGAALTITLLAEADAPTLCSLAPHIYFNLSGAATIDDHRLSVAAERYLPVDRGIPRGAPVPVAGTRFDLRDGAPVPRGIDHNLCLSDDAAPLREIARLQAPNLTMRISSTEPGLQVFDGSVLGVPDGQGLDGRGYGPRAGVALEPQRWPDAPNQAWRGQADLAPGAVFRAETRLHFDQ